MPDAYKEVDLVVQAIEEATLANKMMRLKPKLTRVLDKEVYLAS